MIGQVGIDSVEIVRFNHFTYYADNLLYVVYSQHEINYCRAVSLKSAERFAIRFAAKEASYKAVSSFLKEKKSFIQWCKIVEIVKSPEGVPSLKIKGDMNDLFHVPLYFSLSLTHTQSIATAIVIVTDFSK